MQPKQVWYKVSMDDLNPLAGTANLLEEVDSKSPLWDLQEYLIYPNILITDRPNCRETHGAIARRTNVNRIPAERGPVCKSRSAQDN